MTTEQKATTETRKANLFARTSTAALIGAARLLDTMDKVTAEQRLVYAWTCDELERRAGGIQDDEAFGDFMEANEDDTYAEILLAWFPSLANASV